MGDVSSGVELAAEPVEGSGGTPPRRPSMRVWAFWGLVFVAAAVTAIVVLMSSSAGAAGDCGGF